MIQTMIAVRLPRGNGHVDLCPYTLSRSYSLMPKPADLSRPSYGIIRHPLYVTEELASLLS